MKKFLFFLLILLVHSLSLTAGNKKVAVVLGGGGAKGVAHIGVLKVLEEAGIPVDYVVGTSMGAIVGGLYSIGYSAAEIDSMVRTQDWPMLLSDRIKRNNLTFPEKENAERYILSLPFGKNRQEKTSGGVIKGQNIQSLFAHLTIGYHHAADFNQFRIPFACVAFNLVNGEDYIFSEGSLPVAMRASMAIPAVFTPVRLDSTVLVDGGIPNNFPVDVARQMGADIIIGVDLGTSDLKLLEGINTPGDVLGQIVALYGHEKYSNNRENTDLLFRPDMHPYNSASFSTTAIDTMIRRGEQEARRKWDEIIRLKEELNRTPDTTNPEFRKPVKIHDKFYIQNICFEGIDSRDEKWLLRIIGLKKESYLSAAELERAIANLMGTNAYSHVSYKLVGEDPYDLHFICQDKSTTSFNLGIRYDTEDNVALLLNTTLDYRVKARSKLSLTARIGKSYYGRIDYALERNPLRNINIAYMFNYKDLNIYERGKKTFNTSYQHHFAEIAFSDMSWLNFKVRAGLRYEYFNHNNFLYQGGSREFRVEPEGFISYFASAHLETLDRRYFPNRGVSLEAHYSMYTDNFVGYNDNNPFSALSGSFMTVIPLRSRLSILPTVYGRVLIGGNLAYPYLNAVGGEVAGRYLPHQLPFAGINHIEIFSNSVIIGGIQVRQRMWSRHYLTFTGNYAMHDNDLFNILNGKHVWGASAGYAYNSLGGPLNTSLSISNWNKSLQFFLNLGYYF